MAPRKNKTYKKKSNSLAKQVKKLAIQSKPENKQKYVKVFDTVGPAAGYALTQSLSTSRLLSNLVAGSNNDNVIGTKIFLKGFSFRFYITSNANTPTTYDPNIRIFIFKAGNGLATRATPVISDLLVAPNGDDSDMNAMIDTKKVQMIHNKVLKPSDTIISDTTNKFKYYTMVHNKYIKINKPFQWADTNATLSGSTLGKSGDYYVGFIGDYGNLVGSFVNCEVMIHYTDA